MDKNYMRVSGKIDIKFREKNFDGMRVAEDDTNKYIRHIPDDNSDAWKPTKIRSNRKQNIDMDR